MEEFHKLLKFNAGLAKSPTLRVRTQQNHMVMSMYAVFKLECLKITHKLNHFALRSKLYIIKAIKLACDELLSMRAAA